jgi:hypothetical protein
MSEPATALNYRRLLLVGVLLPAALAWANHLLLHSAQVSRWDGMRIAPVFGFYVLQIGCVGWAVAKYIQPWPLRWLIYGWTMLLTDLQLLVLVNSDFSDAIRCLSSGIFAGQLSLFVVWGIMARGSIGWRLPALVVLLAVYWSCYTMLIRIGQQSWDAFVSWSDLVAMQTALLSLLCGCLRLAGFSLVIVTPDNDTVPAGTSRRSLQFGIRDVLIGTTSLALLLAVAKAGDFLTVRYLRHIYDHGFLFVFTIAISTAAVLIVALWAALGRGHVLVRAITLLVASLAVGGPLGWYCVNIGQPQAMAIWAAPNASATTAYWLQHWYAPGYWWLGWMFLAGTLLAASLVIYRTLGYRLVRGTGASQTANSGSDTYWRSAR